MKKDIYQEVTDRIVAQLERGVIPWHKPWIISGKGCAISRSTGKAYYDALVRHEQRRKYDWMDDLDG